MSKILVVDDVLTDRTLVGGLLTRSIDCSVLEAEHGEAALAQIEKHHPDLVLTDLDMPGLNGLDLVAAVKEDHPRIPVVLITAKGSEDTAAQALLRGAASYVPKRRMAEDLIPTVERVLAASRGNHAQARLMHSLTHGECEFTLSNDPGLAQSLVSYLLQMLRCLPLGDETERLRVGIALDEALSNALYHGNLEVDTPAGREESSKADELVRQRRLNAPYRDRRIHVLAKVSRSEAVFVVRDEGPGFDPQLHPSVDADIAERTSGRGLRLMHAVMDEVSFNETGNEVTLIKRRVQPEVCDEADPDDDESCSIPRP